MRVAAAQGCVGRRDRSCEYLGDELESEKGGVFLLEPLFDLPFLMERAIHCHHCDTVPCTCRGQSQAKGQAEHVQSK